MLFIPCAAVGSSPHTRGARVFAVDVDGRPRIIPAYAGSTLEEGDVRVDHRDHPRIRGEHPYHIIEVPAEYGSSPHTRGAPARSSSGMRITRDHPRIRGEHAPLLDAMALEPGSSPHTRGARYHHRHRVSAVGIIPAYAGSTRGHR